jgi:hypothetical protein
MQYIIRKTVGRSVKWTISEHHHNNVIGSYPTRKQAVFVARLLAGWNGSVSVERIGQYGVGHV